VIIRLNKHAGARNAATSNRRTPSYVDVDYRNRLETAEILAAIRSLDAVPQPQEDSR
jgi:hypothetical protein